MMPCGSGWGFHPKQGPVTLPRFPQPLSAPAGSRVTRPLLRGKMMFNWYTFVPPSPGARWYGMDILAVNILWLYYVDISLSYFPIEFALWANYLSAIWLFVFCSQMVKECSGLVTDHTPSSSEEMHSFGEDSNISDNISLSSLEPCLSIDEGLPVDQQQMTGFRYFKSW